MNPLRRHLVLLAAVVLVVFAAAGASLVSGRPFGSPLASGSSGCAGPIVTTHFSETTLRQFTDAVRKGEVAYISADGENLWYQDAHSFMGHHACLPPGKSVNEVLNGAGVVPNQFPSSSTPQ